MKRLAVTLFALLFATAAHAQSGLLPANQVWAGPPSGGQGYARARPLVAADMPALAVGSFALASGQVIVGQVSGFAGAVAMSGDCTIIASGAIVCTKTNGAAFGTLATAAPGTGVATALGVNVGTAGSVVVNGGALGTPSSGTLTSATGLPVSTGVSGLGTGVATALGVAVGSAGAPVVNGGALGTPASGVGTNLTALNATNLTSGTLPNARVVALPNANLANSTMTISGASVALGGSYAPARSAVAGASPGAGSAVTVMGGLALTITPATSGNILVQFNLTGSNTSGSTGCSAQIAWGTGAAPAHNAATTGTGVGSLVGPTTGTASTVFAIPLSAYITGRTISTTIWIDVQYSQNGGGTCTLGAFNGWAIEQ